jgi:hypothetical protein
MNNAQTKTIAIFVLLIALMAATRADHFGTALHLPDASLAVFLLAGFYMPLQVFPILLIVAGLVDYLAIHYGGVDGWSFSPAYWFLIPTYFVLWFAGHLYAKRHQFSLRGLSEFAAISFVATGVAFLISNISFYFFADYSNKMSVAQYGTQVAQYFLPYLQSAFLYLIAAIVLHIVTVQFSRRDAQAALH